MIFIKLEEPTNSLLKAKQRKPIRYSTQCKTILKKIVSRLKSCYYSRDLHTVDSINSFDNLLQSHSVGYLPYNLYNNNNRSSFQFAHSLL